MAEIYTPEGFYSTTLSADINASTATIPLVLLPVRQTKGYMVIEPTHATKREVIHFTSVGASSVTTADDTEDTSDATGRGCLGSITVGANTSHSQGVVVWIATTENYLKRIIDELNSAISTTTNGYGLYNSSLSRQAIINGNGDVFQRVTFASQTSSGYCLDRWYAAVGGTVTVTQQTTGAPVGSSNVIRVAYNAASSFANLSQALELTEAKKFWGKNVTATVKLRKGGSFAANIAIKVQKNATGNTMTGGTWSDIGLTTIANASLPTGTTSADWVTATVTVAIPSDGTANGIRVTLGESAVGGNGEYYEASQVQLCAGDVALPFQPKSFNDELEACKRYLQYCTTGGIAASTTTFMAGVKLSPTMRATTTITPHSDAIASGTPDGKLNRVGSGATAGLTYSASNISTNGIPLVNFASTPLTAGAYYFGTLVVEGEL